jgi:hypothetical protein
MFQCELSRWMWSNGITSYIRTDLSDEKRETPLHTLCQSAFEIATQGYGYPDGPIFHSAGFIFPLDATDTHR